MASIASRIAAEWSREEAVRVVDEIDIFVGRLGANCPPELRQAALQARRAAWDELIDTRSWEK